MLTLINTNRMVPPIGPIGLDYIATGARKAGVVVDVLDLCLCDDLDITLRDYFTNHNPVLVGLSFRNVDDCFWPSAKWFVPDLAETIQKIRNLTDAPIVIGGIGFSIFAKRIVEYTGADFGIHGDGEQAIVSLYNELLTTKHFENVAGLVWRQNGIVHTNRPAWPMPLSLPTSRDAIDNFTYFRKGGQCGLETKRGCDRQCMYCVDPLAKGIELRLRDPSEVADETESLIAQGVEVVHLCDSEFNIPRSHAIDICGEFISRSLGDRIKWYAYMAVVPFDAELARNMRLAGCVGVDFTGDSASRQMLNIYHQLHSKEDLALAVRLCQENGIKAMVDLLLGGPGETPETLAETIEFIKQIEPDCAGAPIGVRVYPNTEMARIVESEGALESNPNLHRKYTGSVDFFKPTFYISQVLGPRPARLVKDLIAGDSRFFEPIEEIAQNTANNAESTDHNYNDNTQLVEAITQGARGAYWDILHEIRST